MAVRTTMRQGRRVLVIDIWYRDKEGVSRRFRRDAEVQTHAAARAEDRRRLAALAITGHPDERPKEQVQRLPPKPPPPKFAETAGEFLRSYAPTRFKPSTRFAYEKLLQSFVLPRIGTRAIDTVDGAVVRALDAEYAARGAKPETRRKMHVVVRSIIARYAVEVGLLDIAPKFPPLPKVGLKIVRAMTREEVDALLAASHPAHRLAFRLAAFAGLRAGEVRGLRWRDVDLAAGTLVVRQSICRGVAATPKSGHERLVPLEAELRRELGRMVNRAPDAFVAQTARGTDWKEWGLGQAFTRAAQRAGLEGWRFHDLRHYFVTALFRAGVAAPTVQALAGHAHLTTTQRYAHVARVDLTAAIARLTA